MSEAIRHDRHQPGYAELWALVDSAPDAIFTADGNGRYTFVNEAGCRLLGYSRDDVIGKCIVDFIPAEDVPRLLESKAQMLEGGSHIGEWLLRRRDNTWVPVEVHAKILWDGQWQAFVRVISERKAQQAERDRLLAESESQRRWLQVVIETLPLAVLLFGRDEQLTANRRAEELLGMPLSRTGGSAQYANRIFFPDGTPVPPGERVTRRVLEDGETVVAEEYLIVWPDGTRIPILGSAAPIRDEDGRVIGCVGVFQDVSERMRLDEAVRHNERLLEGVFDILPVGVWIADESGRIVRSNPAGRAIWGGARYVTPDNFDQYKGWWIESGKPIAAEEWAMARAVSRGETSLGELVRIQCFDGSFKTIINSGAPLRDASDRIVGAIVVNEDITALHEAQEERARSERLMRTVFELLPVGIWITDREGRIELANRAGQRIWAGARYVGPERFSEYEGWWVETGEPIAPEEWGLSRAIRRGETSRGELIRIRCFDGSSKTVINWAAPIRAENGEIIGAIAVNEDVTSLQQTQEQLRAAVREREELLAIVAHDLRNPLHAITLNARALETTTAKQSLGEPLLELARSVVETSQRMSGLVDDLFAVAVASTAGRSLLKLEPVPAARLLAVTSDESKALLDERGLTMEVQLTGELPTLQVDAGRILRVFANLVDNAAKYTPLGGTVALAAEATGGGVVFSVGNSGEALPPAQIDAMFQPFWQARRDERGAGLGLSICRYIVEEHGGSIWAQPAEGQRVRVCFLIPRVQHESGPGERPP